MIRADIYIAKYDWVVHCYFAVTCYWKKEILNTLFLMGCSYKQIDAADEILECGCINSGLTFSNMNERESIIVTKIAESPAEFLDSLVHELEHLTVHIAMEEGISFKGEEICYLIGDLARSLYPYCKRLLCKHCLKSLQGK